MVLSKKISLIGPIKKITMNRKVIEKKKLKDGGNIKDN